MKVDRVILSVNNNPTYYNHWNYVAPVWKNKFNITPTLVFYGDDQEFKNCNFILDNYDYIILPKLEKYSEPNPDWVVTWSLFYAASKFENDVCMLSGIDQIPLSSEFFKQIKNVENTKFIVGFYDAYLNYNKNTLGYFNTQTNVMYPSSHLVGYGKTFKEIFQIYDDWENEIKKVFESKNLYFLNNNFYSSKMWGIDECYASHKISTYNKQNEIKYLTFFWDYFYPNRIDIDGNINSDFSEDLLLDGYYSEVTCKDINNIKLKLILEKIKDLDFA